MALPYWYGCDNEPASGDGNSTANYTYIFHESCPEAGFITKIEIYIGDESGGVFDFAVMDGPGGAGTYTDEHFVEGLAISNGLNQYEAPGDFAADALPIDIGQWLGVYITSNGIWRKIGSAGPGPGYLYDQNDQIGNGSGSSFSLSGNSDDEFQIRVWISSAAAQYDEEITDGISFDDAAVPSGTQTYAEQIQDDFTLDDTIAAVATFTTVAGDGFTLDDTVSEQLSGAGVSWGEETPTPSGTYGVGNEWSDWKKTGGEAPQTISGSDWGYLNTLNQSHVSNVYDTTTTGVKDFTLATDTWQEGTGSGTVYIRGQLGSFAWDDGTPAWVEITTTAEEKEWQYIQLKVTHSG